MKRFTEKARKRKRRHIRIRARIHGTESRPRLSVFRSNKHLWVQLIDDTSGNTLLSASDRELDDGKKKGAKKPSERAFEVGKRIAERAIEKKISGIVFDRSGYTYHGIIKMVAEGARKGGLHV